VVQLALNANTGFDYRPVTDRFLLFFFFLVVAMARVRFTFLFMREASKVEAAAVPHRTPLLAATSAGTDAQTPRGIPLSPGLRSHGAPCSVAV
jgi:hypothetical protein